MTQVKLQVLYFAMVHLLLLVSKVAGIRCVQCSSLKNPHCVSGKVPPSQCTSIDSGANFCVRYIGKLETGRIVYRDCSERDMGIRCMSKVTLNNETVRVDIAVAVVTVIDFIAADGTIAAAIGSVGAAAVDVAVSEAVDNSTVVVRGTVIGVVDVVVTGDSVVGSVRVSAAAVIVTDVPASVITV
ncbi:Hypothetical predicted protein [Octopus vulgaris]|uniref:Uncharacterized protein n=1 Tax=Octopus vulgaris TaxID=6645 RepID=A0AA36EVA6_OCTVU|nr:Hypothetical predicted protein [Octopus vulgaris]